MTVGRLGGVAGGKNSQPHLFGSNGVVTRDDAGAAVAHQIAARITDVRNDGAIGAQRTGHDGRGHAGLGRRRTALLIHLQIGGLNGAGQNSLVRFPTLGTGKAGEHRLDGKLRCHFTFLLPADTISQDEHASVRAQLLGSVGQQVSQVIFVVLPRAAKIRELGKFYVQHGIESRAASPNTTGNDSVSEFESFIGDGLSKVKGGSKPALCFTSISGFVVIRPHCFVPPAWCAPWFCWSAGSKSRHRVPRPARCPAPAAALSWCRIP